MSSTPISIRSSTPSAAIPIGGRLSSTGSHASRGSHSSRGFSPRFGGGSTGAGPDLLAGSIGSDGGFGGGVNNGGGGVGLLGGGGVGTGGYMPYGSAGSNTSGIGLLRESSAGSNGSSAAMALGMPQLKRHMSSSFNPSIAIR